MTATTQTDTLVDERCRTIIARCLDRISDVRVHYGADVGNEMAASFAYALGRFLSLGGKIVPDGEMGLICVSWITVGMVFFEDSEERTLRKINDGNRQLDHLEPGWPRTGEWSLHS